jgi:hypothetical protein
MSNAYKQQGLFSQLEVDKAFVGAEAHAAELAIRRVEDANSPDPLDEAEADAITALASLPELVSSDTILPDLSRYGFTDNRAMGPIMRRLVAKGFLATTGTFRKSERQGSHRRPTAVYLNTTITP